MKNKKLPTVVSLTILTLITAVFWMMFTIYKSFTKNIVAPVPEEIITPITPRLDFQTIEQIKIRN